MINFKTRQMVILKEAPLQYLSEDVYAYLSKNGRTKDLDDDVLTAQYLAHLDDYCNGCDLPPMWYVRLYLNIRRKSWLKWYYAELEKKMASATT